VPDVYLAGWHGHDELPQFLAASDVMVHASVREQFGLVLVEAMACGVPAIAVDRGGPAMIIEDGETGWLIPPDDREAMADAMVEAANYRRRTAIRGRKARKAVLERYTWERIGRDLAELAQGVIGERPGRRGIEGGAARDFLHVHGAGR